MMMKMTDQAELCFPLLVNTSCKKTQHPRSVTALAYLLLSAISLVTITLNLLVIISISHYKQLKTPTNLILLSLATSDFLVGFLMLFQIFFFEGCWFFGDLVCAIFYLLNFIVTSASIGSMMLISIDRYVAICDPLHYPIKITQTRVKFSMLLCWFFYIVFYCVCFMDILKKPGRYNTCVGKCAIVVNYAAGMIDLFISFIGPITVIVVLYTRVFVVAVSHARAVRFHVGVVTLQRSQGLPARSSELKAARTLGVVVVVFIACIMPYFCITISGQYILINASSAFIPTYLFFFNSCLNPLIYALFYPWFRRSIKLIVTLQILQPDSSQINIL
ncbi:trace amine-associated receptor 13c-like [Vanacampus margaritifer]